LRKEVQVMNKQIPGIHHVTAIASDPQRNVGFYTTVLGLRMVKLTVNFDDPTTYHLYFGDERGSPGTLLTFFPWPGAARGQRGTGQVAATAFAVPEGTLDYWEDRLRQRDTVLFKRQRRFGEEALRFWTPTGCNLNWWLAPVQTRVPRGKVGVSPSTMPSGALTG
jgi:glyoxalase family protein